MLKKHLKKIVSLVLVTMMAIGMSITAIAAEPYQNELEAVMDTSPADSGQVTHYDTTTGEMLVEDSPSFLNRGLGLSPTSNRPRPAGTGAGRFSEVWLHFLCLLRFFFSATKTLPTRPTARKMRDFSAKRAKK